MYGYDIFHEEKMQLLIDNVRNKTNANTYIFEGAKGLRKEDAALLFAKALVCNNTKKAPCCDCPSCTEAQAGVHPDIIFVTKEPDKKALGVKPIRAMINECSVTPFYNHHKVFIINEGDILNTEAQNAFLKVIEEPPEYAVFIIVCTDSGTLLQTVRSRAITITFSPVSDDIVRKYITKTYPDETRIDFLVKYCAGIPLAADDIIHREDFEQLREEALNLVPKLLTKNKKYAYDIVQYIDKHSENVVEIYDMMLLYLRDAIVYTMGAPDKIINTDKREKISKLAATYPPALIAIGIDELVFSKKMVARHVKVSATALHAALKTNIFR